MSRDVFWVVLHSSTHAKCLRCGVEEPLPNLPITVDDWVTKSKKLCKLHSDCKAPTFTEEGKNWAHPLVRTFAESSRVTEAKLAIGHEWISAALLKIQEMTDACYDLAKNSRVGIGINRDQALSEAFDLFRRNILGEK